MSKANEHSLTFLFRANISSTQQTSTAVRHPATTRRRLGEGCGIDVLRDQGLEIVMVTGDNRRTADAVANEVGTDTVVAEVLPDDKIEALWQLRTASHDRLRRRRHLRYPAQFRV